MGTEKPDREVSSGVGLLTSEFLYARVVDWIVLHAHSWDLGVFRRGWADCKTGRPGQLSHWSKPGACCPSAP